MRGFRVGTFGEPVFIVSRFDASAAEGGERIPPAEAAFRADGWFSGPMDKWALFDLYAMIAGLWTSSRNVDAGTARAAVRRALEGGALVAYRIRHTYALGGAPLAEEEATASSPGAAKEENTWLEIELVDDDSPPKPVPFRKYRVELPDFSVREGMLDAHGRARITGVDPGTCKVTFPGLDADDWQLAGAA